MARTGAPAEDRRIDSILLEMTLAKLQYFSADLAKLRAAVAELKGASERAIANSVPSSVYIDADAVGPFERGFYAREYDGEGRAFRWTGDGDFVELRFFINRNIANRFAMTGYLRDNTTIGPVHAFVDYAPVPLEVSYDGNQVILSGELPPIALETRATLTFWSPNRIVPDTGDTRSLWFIFSELSVNPVEEAEPAALPAMAETAEEAAETASINGEEAPRAIVPGAADTLTGAAATSLTAPLADYPATAFVVTFADGPGAAAAPAVEDAPPAAPAAASARAARKTPARRTAGAERRR
jgi:hypothetical protein